MGLWKRLSMWRERSSTEPRPHAGGRSSRRKKTDRRPLAVESLEGRSLMAGLTWDGNSGNGKNLVWSAWSNWSPDRVPQSGDALVFTGSKKLSNVNDLGGLSIPQVTIQSNGFNIDGQGIELGDGGMHLVGGTSATFGLPLAISAPATPLEVTSSRTLTLNDTISGGGGIVKSGGGTAVLSGTNTFTGSTKIAGGSVQLNSSTALQLSTLDYDNAGGGLSFGSLTSAVLGNLSGGQNLALANGANAAVAVTVGGNDQGATYSGAFSGSGSVTKTGNGTWTLTGASVHSGATTVAAGTLALSGSLTNSGVVVTGGRLTGGGDAKSLRVTSGTLAPGDGIGTLTAGNGVSLDGGTLELELTDATHTDLLRVVTGDVTLGGTLSLTAGANLNANPGEVIPLIENAGGGTTGGVFQNYPAGNVISLNGGDFDLRYFYDWNNDGSANDVVLIRKPLGTPLAVADAYSVTEDNTLQVDAPGLLANDSDPDGDPLVILGVLQNPSHGTVNIAPDGGFTYTPAADFSGVDDTLVYQIGDGRGGVSQATVSFTVAPQDDAPVLGANTFRTVESYRMDARLQATDKDSPTLTFQLVTAPAIGTLTLNPDGTFRYDSAAAPANSAARFTYSVSDGTTTVNGVAEITILNWNGRGIRPDVLAWMLENNPGLSANFLQTEPPDKVVLLPTGQSVPIYKLDQFLDVNFQLNFSSRVREKVQFVETQELHLRKLMALPEFYHWIKEHASTYRIGGRGTVTSEQAYDYFRDIHRQIFVTANPKLHAPVGGGNGINAPSWAVWNQMNLFFHEACHVINIGHDSGGLSGPLAGKLRDWDRQARWNYQTINLNTLPVRN